MSCNQDDGSVSFRSHHGRYLCLEDSGSMVANRKVVGQWERFKIESRQPQKVEEVLRKAQQRSAPTLLHGPLPVIAELVDSTSTVNTVNNAESADEMSHGELADESEYSTSASHLQWGSAWQPGWPATCSEWSDDCRRISKIGVRSPLLGPVPAVFAAPCQCVASSTRRHMCPTSKGGSSGTDEGGRRRRRRPRSSASSTLGDSSYANPAKLV